MFQFGRLSATAVRALASTTPKIGYRLSCGTIVSGTLLAKSQVFCASQGSKWICTTPVSLRQQQVKERNQDASIAINKKLVALGTKNEWETILQLFAQEEQNFNHINYATVMSRLARIRSFNKSDPKFPIISSSHCQGKFSSDGLSWMQATRCSKHHSCNWQNAIE